MWPLQTEIIPVVIGALGLIKKGLEKHMAKIPGVININELQKNNFIRNSLKSKIYQSHYALGPWFGGIKQTEQKLRQNNCNKID